VLLQHQLHCPCTAPLAHFYQCILKQVRRADLKNAFHDLDPGDQGALATALCRHVDPLETPNAMWGKQHLFERKYFRPLHKACYSLILHKFDALPDHLKVSVREEIYLKLEKKLHLYALEHIPLIAEALHSINDAKKQH
jgi:hypothetical protein